MEGFAGNSNTSDYFICGHSWGQYLVSSVHCTVNEWDTVRRSFSLLLSLNTMYSLVPAIQLEEVPFIERRFSEDAPSTISLSSKDSSCHITQRKRHDRRKERLNTELLGAVMESSFNDVVRYVTCSSSKTLFC